ncbi:hypothetical protein HDE_03151 [Halotydeus destructor]|nr:hypothetical protein HDE_03151 [Halotydeus destructor]
MKVKISLLLVCFYINSAFCQSRNTKECLEVSGKVDTCLRHALLMGQNGTLPRTVGQMDKMVCSTLNGDMKCIATLRKCLKPFPRTLFNVVVRNINKVVSETICGSTGQKQLVIDYLKCIQSPAELEKWYLIMDRVSVILAHIHKESATVDLLPHMCCATVFSLKRAYKDIDDVCSSRTGDGTVNFVSKVIKSLFGDLADLACGKYRKVENCVNEMPKLIDMFDEKWRQTNSRQAFTALIPVIDILERLDNPN